MKNRSALLCVAGATAMLCVAALVGCEGFGRKKDVVEPTGDKIEKLSPIFADSIGSVAVVTNSRPLMVKGFGVVVGLSGTGSRSASATIRNYLVKDLEKLKISEESLKDLQNVSVTDLIESPNTAIVELTGYIDTGLPAGSAFDVMVSAATGSQTTSLEGGVLLFSKLRIVGASRSSRGIITGRVFGYAQGPLFTNPFAGSGTGTVMGDPRQAIIMSGGIVSEERPFKLGVIRESYPLARKIEQRINERFGFRPKTADAKSRSGLVLATPRQYKTAPREFARLLSRVYLGNSPVYREARLRELAKEAAKPDADYDALSLAWEAMGRVSVPWVKSHYASDNPALSFYAVRAGFRLNDPNATDVLGTIANTPDHPYRSAATEELANKVLLGTTNHLLRLLNDKDNDVRVAAYEGVRRRQHPAIHTRVLRHSRDKRFVNVVVDVVDCDGEPLLYARRTQTPRIALFGSTIPIRTPLFYAWKEPYDLTINANKGEETITVLGRVKPGMPLEKFEIRPRVTDLVGVLAGMPARDADGRAQGLGLCYSHLCRVLSDLFERGAIESPLVFERQSLRDIFGTQPMDERAEGDSQTLEEYEKQLQEEFEAEEKEESESRSE